MANQQISNPITAAVAASASLPTLPQVTSAASMGNLLPTLPPPVGGLMNSGLMNSGLGAGALAAGMMLGGGSTATNLATAGLFANSLQSLVFPSGTTQQQQEQSMMMGAVGLAAVGAIRALTTPNNNSKQAEADAAAAEKARHESEKALAEAKAAKDRIEQQAFLRGNQQSQTSQLELQQALQMRENYTGRDRSKN